MDLAVKVGAPVVVQDALRGTFRDLGDLTPQHDGELMAVAAR